MDTFEKNIKVKLTDCTFLERKYGTLARINKRENIGTKLCKNIDIRRAISSGNPEHFKKLDMIWQPQINDSIKRLSRSILIPLMNNMFSFIFFRILIRCYYLVSL